VADVVTLVAEQRCLGWGRAGRAQRQSEIYISNSAITVSLKVGYASPMWNALFLTLPTQPSAVRLRC
jgi:hypothetical protein